MADSSHWPIAKAQRFMERAIARALAMDPAAQHRLSGLAGRRLRLHLGEPAVSLDVCFGTDGVEFADAAEGVTADATVETTLAGLMSLAASRGQRSRDVVFRGDIGTIQEIRRLVAELDIDWEEQLSHVTGDGVARRVGTGVRRGRDWGGYARGRLLEDVGEYLTEERHLLPTEAEASAFGDEVARLRADVDRLEARLKRLRHASAD